MLACGLLIVAGSLCGWSATRRCDLLSSRYAWLTREIFKEKKEKRNQISRMKEGRGKKNLEQLAARTGARHNYNKRLALVLVTSCMLMYRDRPGAEQLAARTGARHNYNRRLALVLVTSCMLMKTKAVDLNRSSFHRVSARGSRLVGMHRATN